MAVVGLIVLVFLFFVASLAPFIARHSPYEQNLSNRLQPPTSTYIMGTDELGRDIFSRILYGGRVSLTVGFVSVTIALRIGVPLGLMAGFWGGLLDMFIMRLVDIMLCFPTIFLILMVITFLEPNIFNVMFVIGLTSWPSLTRYVRGEVLAVRERAFVQAADMAGYSRFRILMIHILPNVTAPVIITATLGVGSAVLTESVLSFLGLGVQPPNPSWGNILALGREYIGQQTWWLILYPALAIFITVMAFNMVGEGLRARLDPHGSGRDR
ncbi:MAG: ABC transporter permease [Elusimicrobia bacterium]|nr:ABC transporter permease [Elusimicrobiota bacterium]